MLSRGLGVSLQHVASRVFVREGSFDVALLVYPAGTPYPLPPRSPVSGWVPGSPGPQPLAAKSMSTRRPCHAWLFSDCLMVARITEDGGYRFHAVVPLTGGCVVSAVTAGPEPGGVGTRLHEHVVTMTAPSGVLDPVLVAAAMPPLCNDLAVASGPAALSKGELFELVLWPRSAAEAEEAAASGLPADPDEDARASEKLASWAEDLSAVVQGGVSDPLMPRVRSLAARERALAAFAISPAGTVVSVGGSGGAGGVGGPGGAGGISGGVGSGCGCQRLPAHLRMVTAEAVCVPGQPRARPHSLPPPRRFASDRSSTHQEVRHTTVHAKARRADIAAATGLCAKGLAVCCHRPLQVMTTRPWSWPNGACSSHVTSTAMW